MKTLRLLAAATVTLATLTACSPSAVPGPNPASPPPAASTPAGGTSPGAGAEISVADLLALMKQGLVGLKTYAVEISAKGPSLDMTGNGVVELIDASTVHSRLSVISSGRPIELVVYGTSYYLKTGSKWIKLSSTAYGGLGIGSIGDFANAMEAATRYMKSVAVVGPDTVGGFACTHYRVTMDAVAMEKMYGTGFHPAEKTFDWDVWIDASGRVYQAVSSVKVSKGTVTTSTVMSKFNEPVTITPPKV